ncbi:mitofusin-1 [Pundamilia nyererei]|uniref:Mitofusin-1 n=1 Tax=Pundamilia nyererei TaxID=303518 RepID=A0A9Y6J7A6_9CICH|nr:PREDICTED: mitofusin-1-like [Pundamilia nyererei]
MDAVDPSPLRRFVIAKHSITSIFDQLLDFVKDGCAFVDEAWHSEDLGQVAVEEQSLEMQSCAIKLTTIRDVLLRRHMKVAFFGRTSNGKSTVINAMLRDRVLPSGIGHTTNCFLSVEGTDEDEAFLITEASTERRSVTTVNQLAHALHMDPTLDSGTLVKVFWPKSRCALLRDDLVLMDSPGTDVTLELDSWIDKFCVDADVFVLVGNAESTLMNTVRKRLITRLSLVGCKRTAPPAVQVRNQHLDRCVGFLADELKVVGLDDAAGRIFFVSAKEVLSARMQRAQGMPETGGALAEGFHERLREFQRFERTFEEFISQSAVKTKFEQHTVRAWQITEAIKGVMDAINIASADRKICCLEEREDLRDRLDFVRGQINRLSASVKERIRTLSDDVTAKVSSALTDQIRSLPVLVDEFRADFSPTQETLLHYKTSSLQSKSTPVRDPTYQWGVHLHFSQRSQQCPGTGTRQDVFQSDGLMLKIQCRTPESWEAQHLRTLGLTPSGPAALLEWSLPSPLWMSSAERDRKLLQHVEERLIGGLDHRCSVGVLRDIRDAQSHMIDAVRPLLSPALQEQLSTPSASFELTYDLGLAALCADFQENIDFQFSLGWTALVTRFIGAANAKRALSGADRAQKERSTFRDEMVVSIATGLVSVTSRASMTVLVIGGVVWRSVGWRLIALSVSLYGLLYLYEKLTWTDASRERALKQQFVEHAAQRLRAIVPVASSACSHQVCKELSSTFSRLTQRVELSDAELEGNIRQLSFRIQRLENIQRRSKAFRNRATELETQLEVFSVQYLQEN